MESSTTTHEDHFRAGKALGLNHLKLGMWLFIATEVMFFGGLLSAFLHYKVKNPSLAELGLLDVILVGINTFVLLTSSFTVVFGLSAIKRDERRSFSISMGLTILLGLVFLAGQGYEFVSLYREGMTLNSSVFGSSFFTLTGFHGLHVLVGIVWAAATLYRGVRGVYSSSRYDAVEVFGLYWHFVDIVWIILFTLIYLT